MGSRGGRDARPAIDQGVDEMQVVGFARLPAVTRDVGGSARDQDRHGGTLRGLGCGLSAASQDGSRSGSWRQLTSNFLRCSLPINRLVTGNLSLVTGDFQKLIPSTTLFSISSYQLPVTSYQSKRPMVRGHDRNGHGGRRHLHLSDPVERARPLLPSALELTAQPPRGG